MKSSAFKQSSSQLEPLIRSSMSTRRGEMENLQRPSSRNRSQRNLSHEELSNFALNDDVHKKTINRRLAEYLMQYQWYYPKIEGGPSLEEAWAYYEHITLPRYLFEENEKAEPGETRDTELYSPLLTPHGSLKSWGIGVSLYFSNMWAMMVILFVAGLINIPNIIYYSTDYTTNEQSGLSAIMNKFGLLLRGSAVCTDSEWYPCSGSDSCSPGSWGSSRRFARSTEEEDLYFMERNECRGAEFNQGIYNWATLMFIIICFVLYSFYQRYSETKADQEILTATDYSIEVLNPPPDAINPEEWKDFFSQFAEKQLTVCTIGLNNSTLIQALLARRRLLKNLGYRYPDVNLMDREKFEETVLDIEENEQDRKSDKKLIQKIEKLELKIEELQKKKYDAIRVYVTFETEEGQRNALAALSVGLKDIWFNNQGAVSPTAVFKNRVLKVRRPVEPSGVLWKYAGVKNSVKFRQRTVTFLIMIGLIFFMLVIIPLIGDIFVSAVIITVANILVPLIAKALVGFEAHGEEGGRQIYIFLYIFVFRVVSTAILYLILTRNTNYITIHENDLLPKILALFVSELFLSPILRLSNIWGNIQMHCFAPRAKTQEGMNLYFHGVPVNLAERYTDYSKVNYLCFFYGALFPGAFFISAGTHLLNYFTDKFSLMRIWAPTPELGAQLPNFHRRYIFSTSVLLFALMSSFHYARFPFDNVCLTSKSSRGGIYNVAFLNGTGTSDQPIQLEIGEGRNYTVYCNQNILSFPAIPSIQNGIEWMTPEQKKITTLYGWTSVVVLVIYIFYVFGNSIANGLMSIFRGVPLVNIDTTDIDFSNLNGEDGYVPEVNEFGLSFPLIACDIDDIDHGLLGWKDPNNSYDYHNLIFDVPHEGMRRKERRTLEDEENEEQQTSPVDANFQPVKPIFGIVKHWRPEWKRNE